MTKFRFKLLRGAHADDSGVHEMGEVFDTDQDLNLMNAPGGIKFEQVSKEEEAAAEPPPPKDDVPPDTGDDLEGMTVSELKSFAAEEEVDLTGVSRKADIIAAIWEVLS